jgi:hypothetical protein
MGIALLFFNICVHSHNLSNNNCRYIHLSQLQSLDPVSARCTANIKQLIYYVENQLRQLNEQLDIKWLEFQDSFKPSVRWISVEIDIEYFM